MFVKPCPVCGIAAKDEDSDQIAIWGLGVFDHKLKKRFAIDVPMKDMRILHKNCLQHYIDGLFIDLIKSKDKE